jgi:hypothetical protein
MLSSARFAAVRDRDSVSPAAETINMAAEADQLLRFSRGACRVTFAVASVGRAAIGPALVPVFRGIAYALHQRLESGRRAAHVFSGSGMHSAPLP